MLEFVDKLGHIFKLNTYRTEPIGYERVLNKYIFWVENNTNFLSINNYYILLIKFAIPYKSAQALDKTKITIKCESSVFSLLSAKYLLERYEDLQTPINITNILLTTKNKSVLYSDEIDGVLVNTEDDMQYVLVPFYVVANSKTTGTWTTNILIQINYGTYSDYCPITVGAEFNDEEQALVINGLNMGIKLPKDIIRAVYDGLLYNTVANETLYNEKLKELLLNYMGIRGECGNYNSAIKALKWFGWGNKIEMSSLLRITNDYVDSYIRDLFSIDTDIMTTYNDFRHTTLLSLVVKENQETGGHYSLDTTKDFWGEGTPILEDLFNKTLNKEYDLNYDENGNVQKISYIVPYYKYCLEEMAFKITLLAQYYETYFLPLHLDIFNASIEHRCFMNDIKISHIGQRAHIGSETMFVGDNDVKVTFPDTETLPIYKLQVLIDDNFNHFTNYDNADNDNVFMIDDVCINVPIAITSETDKYFNCKLVLERLCDESLPLSILEYNTQADLLATNIKYIYINDVVNIPYTNESPISKVNMFTYSDTTKLEDFTMELVEFTSLENVIAVKFTDITKAKYVSFGLISEDGGECFTPIYKVKNQLFESNFSYIKQEESDFESFVISPRIFGLSTIDISLSEWLNDLYRLYINVNDKWFDYTFKVTFPNLIVDCGCLEYRNPSDNGQYGYKLISELSSDKVTFNLFDIDEALILVSDSNYIYNLRQAKETDTYNQFIIDLINKNWELKYIPQDFKYNNIVIYGLITDKNGIDKRYNSEDTNFYYHIYNTVFNTTEKIASGLELSTTFNQYIMHDNDVWYVVLISRLPWTSLYSGDTLKLTLRKLLRKINKKTIEFDTFNATNFKAYSHFLVNRMNFSSTLNNGYQNNSFALDDLICVRLLSGTFDNNGFNRTDINESLMFNYDNSPKWKMTYIDPVNPNSLTYTSITNATILSYPQDETEYKKGYYTIEVRYNLLHDGDNYDLTKKHIIKIV